MPAWGPAGRASGPTRARSAGLGRREERRRRGRFGGPMCSRRCRVTKEVKVLRAQPVVAEEYFRVAVLVELPRGRLLGETPKHLLRRRGADLAQRAVRLPHAGRRSRRRQDSGSCAASSRLRKQCEAPGHPQAAVTSLPWTPRRRGNRRLVTVVAASSRVRETHSSISATIISFLCTVISYVINAQ